MPAADSSVRSVAIVGGGPAGLIAAEYLATAGCPVTIYDARRSVGRKFLLAGRSGLNLTHSEPLDDLTSRYGSASARLQAALRSFSPDDLRSWSDGLGGATFVGTSGRVFPQSMRATPLLRSWLRRLDDLGVEFALDHRWIGWNNDGALVFATASGEHVARPDATVFALGGASWPRVSSDGAWANSFSDAGIEVHQLVAANCGIETNWSPVMVERFAGVPVKNVSCSVGDADAVRGDIVVTATGFEGGPIYALGPAIRHELATGVAELVIDTAPDLSHDQLGRRLAKRRPKASATSWLRSAGIAPGVVALAREATANTLPAAAPDMAMLLKALPIDIAGLAPIDRAISTAGGIAFDEVDEHFMLMKRPGTFVAGEMLDWDAPTGGYLLQACFSTGVAAARGVLAY